MQCLLLEIEVQKIRLKEKSKNSSWNHKPSQRLEYASKIIQFNLFYKRGN